MDRVPYAAARLIYVLNTEIAPVTETALFNTVPLKGAKIRYITFCILVEWFLVCWNLHSPAYKRG